MARFFTVLLIFVALSASLAAARPSATGPLQAAVDAPDLATYRQNIQQARAALPPLPALDQDARQAESAAWPDPARDDARGLLARVRAVESAEAATPPPEERVVRVRKSLDDILYRSEFIKASAQASLYDRIITFLSNLFRGFFHGMTSLGLTAQLIVYSLAATFIVVVVFMLVSLVSRSLQNRESWRRQRASAAEDDPIRHVRHATEWLTLADQARERGEQRLAIRYLYLAVLQRLGDLGAVNLRSGQTNWDIIRLLGAHPLRADVVAATCLFESRWYAMRPVQASDFEVLMRHYASLSVDSSSTPSRGDPVHT